MFDWLRRRLVLCAALVGAWCLIGASAAHASSIVYPSTVEVGGSITITGVCDAPATRLKLVAQLFDADQVVQHAARPMQLDLSVSGSGAFSMTFSVAGLVDSVPPEPGDWVYIYLVSCVQVIGDTETHLETLSTTSVNVVSGPDGTPEPQPDPEPETDDVGADDEPSSESSGEAGTPAANVGSAFDTGVTVPDREETTSREVVVGAGVGLILIGLGMWAISHRRPGNSGRNES